MKDVSFNRRDFLRLSGLATAGVLAAACGGSAPAASPTAAATVAATGSDAAAAATPAAATAAGLREVARDKTLILMFGGSDGQFLNTGLGNMYATGSEAHRAVSGA